MIIKVTLEQMHFYAHHGCYDTEQRVGGQFLVDLSYSYNAEDVVQSDDILRAVSYLDIYGVVQSEMNIASRTLEHVAYRISERLLSTFSELLTLEITLKKVSPPLGGDLRSAAVTLQRSK